MQKDIVPIELDHALDNAYNMAITHSEQTELTAEQKDSIAQICCNVLSWEEIPEEWRDQIEDEFKQWAENYRDEKENRVTLQTLADRGEEALGATSEWDQDNEEMMQNTLINLIAWAIVKEMDFDAQLQIARACIAEQIEKDENSTQ